ncbi:MAG: hypothetical protein ACI35R_06755 [Bacillus sp. (in: firmicutes)]
MKKAIVGLSIALLAFLSACNSSSKVVSDYDESALNADFGGHPAYEIGANAEGMPIFTDYKKALEQAKIDYEVGFEAIAEERDLQPVDESNYEDYLLFGWQLETEDEALQEQGVMISKFLDIYANSFD